MLDSLQAEHQPATPTEVILVRQMAMASWRLQRLMHMEAAHYRIRRDNLEAYFEKYYTDLTEPARQAIIVSGDDTLIKFSRYEARLERSFHKGLTDLQRLRAERKKELTNQSQSHPDVGAGHARPGVAQAASEPQLVAQQSWSGPVTDISQPVSKQASCIFADFPSPS